MYSGRRTFAGYSYVTRRTPASGTGCIVKGFKKVCKRVPNHVNKRVLHGSKVIATEVPKYGWRDVQVGWTANLPEWANCARDATIALGISTRVVDDLGHLGVSATQEARALTNLRGTFYNPSTAAKTIGGSVIKNSLSKASVLTAVIGSAAVNLYDFQYGCEKEKGVGSPEFFASTMVDVGTSLVVGAAAAFVGTVFSAAVPAAVIFMAATALGAALGGLVDNTGVPEKAKKGLAGYLSGAGISMNENITNPPLSSSFESNGSTGQPVFSGLYGANVSSDD